MGKIIIRVPATSANLGAGINSLGVSLQLYYTVIVEEETDYWRVNHAMDESIPHDENNLIVQTILRIDQTIAPHQLTIMSDVPKAHGLGSSTTAVVAGIKVANILGHLKLSLDEQINIGNRMEGHPENVAAAILGDLTISEFDNDRVTTVKAKMPDIAALAFIRNESADVKQKLPKNINLNKAIYTSSISNVLIASIMNNEWSKAAMMIEKDGFHEQQRNEKVPELNIIRSSAHKLGIYGTYLSGSGPTIITFGERYELNKLRDQLNDNKKLDGTFNVLKIDRDGTTVRGE